MNYSKNILLFLIFQISPIISELYHLQKIPARLKTLHRSHRNLSPENDSYFLEQVYGDSAELNYYYATLYLGPKKTPQTFILDTGSPTTTSPCSVCTSCGKHLNKPYEFTDNSRIVKCNSNECNILKSSCRNSRCIFSISYLEGSRLEGFFNIQDVYFENINNSPIISTKFFTIPIGCTTTETHLFATQLADGIMGLNNSGQSFVSLLFKNKIISKEIFSICFGQNDGYFSIGEIDTKYHKSSISYVHQVTGNSNYYININNMKVGSDTISTYNYNVFIDSGTTITYFPRQIYNSIISSFNKHCKNKCGKFEDVSNIGYCAMFKSKEEREKVLNNYWPKITLVLEGYNYVLTPNDYYFGYNEKNKIGACLGFEGEGASKITLGGTFMHGHDIIFDRDNQLIGFAEADCNRGTIIKKEINKENINNIPDIPDNDTFINNVEENNKIKMKFNNNLLIGIIVVSSLLVICLIILVIFLIRKNNKIKAYNPQVDESSSNNRRNNINNKLEIKNQNTGSLNNA